MSAPVPPSPETHAATPDAPAGLPNGLAHCTEAELLQRAKALLALGNSPLQIQVALVQSGVAPELVQGVVATMRQLAHEQRQRQLRYAWLMTALVFACLVLAAGIGVRLWHPAGVTVPGAAETPQPPTPTGVAGFLLSLPTPVVQTAPPQTTATGGVSQLGRCPNSAIEAASVFGGQAADWTYKVDAGGWIMTAIMPQIIYIPAGMLAGYLQFGQSGANVNQINGPARIHNVNFIAITCP